VWTPPEPAGPTPEMLARRIALVGVDDALGEDGGWYIGQLRLRGVIGWNACEAARRFRRLADTYRGLLMALTDGPTPPRALPYERLPAGRGEIDERRFVRVRDEYEKHYGAVAEHGWRVRRALARALRDEPQDLDLLRKALDALRISYGMPPDRKAVK
jgi:hypothetical protein